MSPARQHRDRHTAITADVDHATPIESVSVEGGQSASAPAADELLSPARRHRLLHSALGAAIGAVTAGPGADPAQDAAPGEAPPANTAEAQMRLRLVHDLRRLKEIKAIDAKIAAKREMIPAYAAWVEGLLAATAATGQAAQEEILPTMMIWLIDTGDFGRALDLADHVIAHGIALPARYERDAATLVVEEIADAALKPGLDAGFPLAILDRVEDLVDGVDMHDQVRAKLNKAIGIELQRLADANPDAPDIGATRTRALAALREAQRLDDRVGVKGRITALEKVLGATPAPPSIDVTAVADRIAGAAADSAVALHAALTTLSEQNTAGDAG